MSLATQYLTISPSSVFSKLQSNVGNKNGIRAVVGSVVISFHTFWKLLRKLSLAGNSKNPILRYFHKCLKDYLNCGFMVRSEFYVQLPWQFFYIFKGSEVIVNYGSYGTVPIAVLEYQISLQKEMEKGPDRFFRITMLEKYEESRAIVAKYVGCIPENLVFVDNITDGINCLLRSFLKDFGDDEAVLTINVGYTAVLKMAAVYTKLYNVDLLQLYLTFPIISEDQICEAFEEMFKKHRNIKLAIFDHITSASAVCLPIAKLAKLCRDYDIISVVDGAHAPGQLFLNIESYGADLYIGNLHKWYYTPKSCAVMYINPRYHDCMYPSLVSHACYEDLHYRFRRQGTKNYTAHITAGYAVGEFMEKLGGIQHLHTHITPLVEWAVQLYIREWNTEELSIPHNMKAPYMRIVYIPQIFAKVYGATYEGADQMIIDMMDELRIAMFINPIQGRLTTRVSAQIFSSKAEYVYVASAIKRKAKELERKFL